MFDIFASKNSVKVFDIGPDLEAFQWGLLTVVGTIVCFGAYGMIIDAFSLAPLIVLVVMLFVLVSLYGASSYFDEDPATMYRKVMKWWQGYYFEHRGEFGLAYLTLIIATIISVAFYFVDNVYGRCGIVLCIAATLYALYYWLTHRWIKVGILA